MSLSQNKVTDNTHEMSFHELMSQTAQLRVPLFQRPYVWTDKQFDRMTRELDSIIEGEDTNRFLGAIIAVRRNTNPAAPQSFEIVDGQQRLTTLYLFMMAAAQVAAKNTDVEYATGLINSNLFIPWLKGAPNTKFIPSFADREQFRNIYRTLFATQGLAEWLPNQVILPEASATNNSGRLEAQFNRIKKYLQKRYHDQGLEGLTMVVEAARNQLTYVFILLKDPSTSTTVFEGLNDPGIPIGVGDLVRNEIFAKVGDSPEEAIAIHSAYWAPFQEKLGKYFDDYFFPYCVVHKPSTRRADMFRELRDMWEDTDDANDLILKLDEYTDPFLAIVEGRVPDEYSAEVKEGVLRLVRMKRPAAVYPFVMRLLRAYELRKIDSKVTRGIIDVIESFLARRALVGVEPTGLLGLFRVLWNNIEESPNAENVIKVILRRLTIEWPDDDRLREQILNRPLYNSAIAGYVLMEYERSHGADFPVGATYWIEHIAPQKLTSQWREKFTEEQHKSMVNTWANLVPLSPSMNNVLGQKPFLEKRESFRTGSMFASPRMLADEFADWTPTTIQERSITLANWAVERWPRTAQ